MNREIQDPVRFSTRVCKSSLVNRSFNIALLPVVVTIFYIPLATIGQNLAAGTNFTILRDPFRRLDIFTSLSSS